MKRMICNMCGHQLTHYNYNGTFIWLCEEDEELETDNVGCANVQLEIWEDTDIVEFNEFLKLTREERKKYKVSQERNDI